MPCQTFSFFVTLAFEALDAAVLVATVLVRLLALSLTPGEPVGVAAVPVRAPVGVAGVVMAAGVAKGVVIAAVADVEDFPGEFSPFS